MEALEPYERARMLGAYVAESGCTVRDAALHFGVNKSTVHKDLVERLPGIDKTLYRRVRCILDINKAERHLRGGYATQQKFLKLVKTSAK